MWNKFEASCNEDDTLGGSFFTNGIFKIFNEEEVKKFLFLKKIQKLKFFFNYRALKILLYIPLLMTRV